MKKSDKKRIGKFANTAKIKPYTAKQEGDILLGKIIHWSFIIFLPISGICILGMSYGVSILFLVWGILILLYATYLLLGTIFKWDHAKVFINEQCKKHDKSDDIRHGWNKGDTKDGVSVTLIFGILGISTLLLSIYLSYSM